MAIEKELKGEQKGRENFVGIENPIFLMGFNMRNLEKPQRGPLEYLMFFANLKKNCFHLVVDELGREVK